MFKFKPNDKVVCIKGTKDSTVQPGFEGKVICSSSDKMFIENSEHIYLVNKCDFAYATEIEDLEYPFKPNIETQKQMINDMFKEGEENKKGIDIMKLLEIYEEKQRDIFRTEFDKEEEEIIKEDEISKRIKEFEEQLQEEFKQTYIHITIEQYEYTDKTKDMLQSLRDDYEKKRFKLSDKIDEIKAQLEICENYEQKIKVLENYEVIDKKTHQLI